MSVRFHALRQETVVRELVAEVGGAEHRTHLRHASVVTLEADFEGSRLVGVGEAAPLPGYSLDTLDEDRAAIEAFAAQAPLAIDVDLTRLEARTQALPPAARFAIETALLDVLGQASGRPLWSVLAPGLEPRTAPIAAVLLGPDDALAEEAAGLIDIGFRTLKRKLDPAHADAQLRALAGLSALRASGVALRLDCNRAFTPAGFAQIADRVHALRPELVEEPIDGDPLTLASALPIALDESLAAPTAEEAQRRLRSHGAAIRTSVIHAVCVKPARDGLLGALALAREARSLGALIVVAHLWDGPIGHLAAIHLALALDHAETAQGLAPQPGLAGDERWLHALLRAGRLHAPTAPGLRG